MELVKINVEYPPQLPSVDGSTSVSLRMNDPCWALKQQDGSWHVWQDAVGMLVRASESEFETKFTVLSSAEVTADPSILPTEENGGQITPIDRGQKLTKIAYPEAVLNSPRSNAVVLFDYDGKRFKLPYWEFKVGAKPTQG